jgi:hypothetical protein
MALFFLSGRFGKSVGFFAQRGDFRLQRGGRGLAGRDPEDDEPCPTCLGDGAIEPGAEVCEAPESDTPHGLCDDEPGDIDNDAGYDPYAGGPEDDGYDTGTFDDGFCDDASTEGVKTIPVVQYWLPITTAPGCKTPPRSGWRRGRG